MDKWISLQDKKPPQEENVLIFDSWDDTIYVGYMYYSNFIIVCDCHEGSTAFEVSHWMPLPKEPND